ncbi:MAG: hypothetical protein DRN05_03790 [Thermoplasmata archaeon]|nr:MAG: hypothetical protein DRN05_03790 [Thermoplasmata archaeon]
MKKIWIAAAMGLLMISMATVVSAENDAQKMIYSSFYGYKKPVEIKPRYAAVLDDQQLSNRYMPTPSDHPRRAKFVGIWGYLDDNTTKGYVGGIIEKRGRFGYLRGRWNTTDNSTRGRVTGILKKGFFIGKITINNERAQRIVGLYRLDSENKVFHMRWMTPHKVGWAHCRIKLI